MTPDNHKAILEKKLIELSFSETCHILIVLETKKMKAESFTKKIVEQNTSFSLMELETLN
jgi:hypothetical protein